MRRLFLIVLVLCLKLDILPAQDTEQTSDRDEYRRSSLCLILLTHRGKKYAQEMERVFRSFPMPARYNEHNISDLRVISVSGKQNRARIDRLVNSNYVAQKIIGRWFDRNPYTGYMDMNLIHDRGGYGAFYADYQRSQQTVRGTDLLRDEGVELLQSTFVLVCDMDYIDKSKRAGWGAFGMALLSAGMQTMSRVNYNQAQSAAARGDYSAARRKMNAAEGWNAGSAASMAGAAVVADIGGFRVKMSAYLYKLDWNDAMTQVMYNDYWIDANTPYGEQLSKKERFDHDAKKFKLTFIGQYKATSSKTILRSWKNEDEVILDVCERCVNRGMRKLAKSFPVFRPRTPYYFDGGTMYSHIGRKEDVAFGQKYEVVQRCRDKHGRIFYKRVGKVVARTPWNNREVRFDQYFDSGQKGTSFQILHASVDLQKTPGLQIREL